MLSRWFKSKISRNSQQEHSKAGQLPHEKATPSAALVKQAPKPKEPSLLEQLTGGQAIETLTDLAVLHQLLKQSDKLDKRSNRSVRERLNVLRDEEKTRIDQRAQQEKLCTRMETLARLQHHPLFESEVAHVQQQWSNVGLQDPDVSARIDIASQQCQNISQEVLQQKQQAEASARAAEQLKQLQAEQAALLAETQEAEQAAQALVRDEQAQTRAASTAEKQQSAAEQQKNLEKNTQTLQQQLTQLETAIDEANSKQARQLLDQARETLKKLDHARAQRFDGKLHLLQGQLRELQDWQNFAAMPKLEALCAAMEKLASIELPAPEKADAIRELQNQWRAMKAPTSKQAQSLWDQFKKASDIAWVPCAAHFEKEKQLRTFNLQQRQAICDALEQFHAQQDWAKADWKAVARILEKARQEFHDFHPVERHDDKPIRLRFDAAMNALQQKLLGEQHNNEAKKQQLIDTVETLHSMADVEKAIERIRQLQEQWKAVGLTRRHEDQKLWQRFQERCNALYEKRKASQQQQWQAQNEQVAQAKSLCDAIHALAKLPDNELTNSQADFDALQAQFKAITTIPEKQQPALKKLFYEACDHYRGQLTGISKRQRDQQWQHFAQQALLCAELEQNPAAVTTLAAQWQPDALPAEWKAPLQQRWEQALALAAGTIPAALQAEMTQNNEHQRRMICIELEILLDAETPEEDRNQRREFQMQRLAKGLGQGGENRADAHERLLAQWHCCGSASVSAHTALTERFSKLAALR